MDAKNLSREDIDAIVAELCSAVDLDDHEMFLKVFRDGAARAEDRALARDCIMDGLIRVAMRDPEGNGKKILSVLTRAADILSSCINGNPICG